MAKCPECGKDTTVRSRTEECSCGWWHERPYAGSNPDAPDPRDTRITTLEAEVARLREVLGAIVAAVDDPSLQGSIGCVYAVGFAIKAARAALAQQEPGRG